MAGCGSGGAWDAGFAGGRKRRELEKMETSWRKVCPAGDVCEILADEERGERGWANKNGQERALQYASSSLVQEGS
jgi:hypothetical protein